MEKHIDWRIQLSSLVSTFCKKKEEKEKKEEERERKGREEDTSIEIGVKAINELYG